MKEENFHYLGTLFNYRLVIDNLFWMNERVCQALGYPYCLFWCKFYQQFSTHLTFKLSTNFVPGNKIRTKGWARGGLTVDKENPPKQQIQRHTYYKQALKSRSTQILKWRSSFKASIILKTSIRVIIFWRPPSPSFKDAHWLSSSPSPEDLHQGHHQHLLKPFIGSSGHHPWCHPPECLTWGRGTAGVRCQTAAVWRREGQSAGPGEK